jgi:hypothetical protein
VSNAGNVFNCRRKTVVENRCFSFDATVFNLAIQKLKLLTKGRRSYEKNDDDNWRFVCFNRDGSIRYFIYRAGCSRRKLRRRSAKQQHAKQQ